MNIVHVPGPVAHPPKKPSWWSGWFKKTGTIVEHNGCKWILLESYSWMDYEGRDWYRYELEIPPTTLLTDRSQLEKLMEAERSS